MCHKERKLRFDNYKYCLEKNEFDVNSLRENHKEIIKKNRLILKSQQRCRCD